MITMKISLYEETEVKDKPTFIFQTIAGAINVVKRFIPTSRWQDQYQPKRDVQYTIYSDLMKYPTLDEWIDNVKSLPNNKALVLLVYPMKC
ncbi:hypothetical protein RCL_jg78.t1 [Rhizophagus clarus]|uniref:Uncharacterized protein n=1 Tax=Rhizophagus clarus TaxID=94130 RepID=A0A8H3R077_9GLOM|nr:hypothetical protein RCL_jg78.t1 [Rhizophagus clarus]